MILESTMRIILHCSRCNTPLTNDEYHSVALWRSGTDIEKQFDPDGIHDMCGWRRFKDRYTCPDCQTLNDDGDYIENPEPLPPVGAAVINRAQALYSEGMLTTLSRSDVRAWLLQQTETPIRDALLAALDAVFADRLEDWGPAVGSKAEGAYERAFNVFHAIEDQLRPSIAATVMEATP